MKSVAVSSTRTPTSTARNHKKRDGGGGRGSESCYYPGCRKDANCQCDICFDSFSATRDLILNHSTTTTTSSSMLAKRKIEYPPPPNKNIHSPTSTTSSSSLVDLPRPSTLTEPEPDLSFPNSPSSNSAAIKKRAKMRSWGVFFLVGFLVIYALNSGFLMFVSKNGPPKLTPEIVRGIGEEARVLDSDFKKRLGFLQRKVEGFVGVGRVSNCSSQDSLWKLNQEGHHFFFLWRCVIFQSMAEELSVWGGPLQTSGLVVAGLSSRSITLLSGRMTEWSDGKLVPTLRTSNSSSSWTLRKWSSAAVQLEKETWVLEYQRSALFEGPGLIQTTCDIIRLKLQKIEKKLKFWLFIRKDLAGTYNDSYKDRRHPT